MSNLNRMAPAVSILHLAELDAGETLVKGVAGGAYRTVGTESEGPGDFGGTQHGLDVDMRHGGDHDRSAAGETAHFLPPERAARK